MFFVEQIKILNDKIKLNLFNPTPVTNRESKSESSDWEEDRFSESVEEDETIPF